MMRSVSRTGEKLCISYAQPALFLRFNRPTWLQIGPPVPGYPTGPAAVGACRGSVGESVS